MKRDLPVIDIFSPLPPLPTDIANHTVAVLRALAPLAHVRAWTDQPGPVRPVRQCPDRPGRHSAGGKPQLQIPEQEIITTQTGHIVLIVSLPLAEEVLGQLMRFWQTAAGTCLLATALAVHVMNALWSVYIRRYLRMPAWELAQLCLGLSIPPLIMLHVAATKIADGFLDTASDYQFVLMAQWLGPARGVALQMAAVLALWVHACIGLHFAWRLRPWYRDWLPTLYAIALGFMLVLPLVFVATGVIIWWRRRKAA